MAYTRTTWVDGSTPAINATNLNNIEQGLVDLHSGDITITGTKTFSGAVALNDVGKLYVGPQTYASDAALSVIEDGHAILYLIPNGSTETTMIRAGKITVGTGDYRVGLPVAPKQSSSYPRIGGAQLGQASQYMHMQMELYPSSNYGQLLGASTTTWSGLTFCNSTLITSPNTLSVSYWFMYEAA